MNLLHMKYAVEVAKAGSINKASETLLIAQPNLSRSVKELESDLGITIFDRSAKGMFLTQEGEEFIGYAKKILDQIDEVETMYRRGIPIKQKFSVCVPRASYIADAFSRFTESLNSDYAEIYYEETGTQRALKNVMSSDYKLGIIRYAEIYDKQFKSAIEDKGLAYEVISEFVHIVLTSKDSGLAALSEIHLSDLDGCIEIAHPDPFVPSIAESEVKKEELGTAPGRRIYVYERASQFDILSKNPESFMWVSPVPEDMLERYGLVQLLCAENIKVYKDVLIYKKDYDLTKLDLQFVTELCESRRKLMP